MCVLFIRQPGVLPQDIHTYTHTYIHTGIQAGRGRHRQTYRQSDRQAGRLTDRQTDRQTERETDRQTYRRTDRREDRHADKRTPIQKHIHIDNQWVPSRPVRPIAGRRPDHGGRGVKSSQAGRQDDAQTDGHRHIQTDRQTYRHRGLLNAPAATYRRP